MCCEARRSIDAAVQALWSDKKGHGRPTCVWLLGHAYFYLPPGPATEALGTWFLDKLQGELSSKASRVFSHTHEALAPGSFAIFCMALRSAELARTAVPIMLQLAQRENTSVKSIARA